jgi:hypothetical protein
MEQAATQALGFARSISRALLPVERELEWFFSRGQSLFERSSFGRQLEEAQRSSAGSRKCRACNNQRSVRDEHGRRVAVIDPERDGGTPGVLADGTWCPRCAGTGSIPCAIARSKHRVDAQPTGHEVRDHGYVPADEDLRRHARVSRWLKNLERKAPWVERAVSAYYGNDAGIVSQIAPWGAWLAVAPMTAAGDALLERTYRPGSEVSMRKIERIRVQAVLEQVAPARWRRQLLDAAQEQGSLRVADGVEIMGRWWREEQAEAFRRHGGDR